jgi:hypothetical protein
MAAKVYFCKFSKCQPEFQTRSALVEHTVAAHQFYHANSKNELYIWCRYCESFVWEMASTSAPESHFEGHVEQAIRQAEEYGCCGVELHYQDVAKKSKARAVIPRQCIFCLHDENLSAKERIAHMQLYGDPSSTHKIHIDGHVKKIGGGTAFCPASAAGGAARPLCLLEAHMSAEELTVHSRVVHGIVLKSHTTKRDSTKAKAEGR